MKPVTWGVLSVSRHFRLRVQSPISGSESLTVRAIASRSRQKAEEAAREMGIAKAYGSYEELLADREIEAVYITLPNNLHAEWVMKAADAGKHVLCEKPFAMNAAEAEKAIRYAEKKGVLIMEAFMYRFHPQWQRARELVRIGEIGDVHTISTVYSYTNKDPKNIRNRLDAGGGAIQDIGCYAISSARFLMGCEPRRAIAFIRRDPEFGTDILSSAILDFGHARAIFSVGTQSFGQQRVHLVGSAGSLVVPLPFNAPGDAPSQITVTTGIATRAISFPVVDQYRLMFEGFSAAVRTGGPVPTPPQDAIDNMRVEDALFRSEASGGWEEVR
jgi:predicted dehydrogenase